VDRSDVHAMIRLVGVEKRYPDGTVAVHRLSLDVAPGEFCVLVGPSGCGKTTTMKMVNRLVEPTSGRVYLDGEDVTAADPVALRRRIGYVIQQVGLFPHQTVRANVGTVPSLLAWDKRRTRDRVDELLHLVGLDPAVYGDRYPAQLSGGQRQRVGVARALGADPPVLLMDEPFGAVDPVARERLQTEFLRLQSEVRKTIVFVTHDIDEAVRLGDRVAVLSQGGVLEQYADPATLLGAPANDFVASFVGADRGLRRLGVTGIAEDDLERPPVVPASAPVAAAREALGAARWGVVVDRDRRLVGWVRADRLSGDDVARVARPVEAVVPLASTLRDAFAQVLQTDSGWVAVVDGDRYLGVLTLAAMHTAARRSAPTP
jgi:osmoprotectant transport system ATP-binding protein